MSAEVSSSGSVPDVLSSIVFTSGESLFLRQRGRSAREKLFLMLWFGVKGLNGASKVAEPNGCTLFKSTTCTVTFVK